MKIKAIIPTEIGKPIQIGIDPTGFFIVKNNDDLQDLYENNFRFIFLLYAPSISYNGMKYDYTIIGMRNKKSYMSIGYIIEFRREELRYFIKITDEHDIDFASLDKEVYLFNKRRFHENK